MTLRSIAFAVLAVALPLAAHAAEEEKGYYAWAEAQGLVGVFAAPDFALDDDGVMTNLKAYAFGMDPLTDDDTCDKLPFLSEAGDPPEPVITFVLPKHVPQDVSYIIETKLADGKRVEIARKDGSSPWFGAARILKKQLDDGSTEVSVLLPLGLEVAKKSQPLILRVELNQAT